MIAPFLSLKTHTVLYTQGNTGQKVLGVARGFLSRIKLLFSLQAVDYVLVHREATPVGPPVIEWVIARVWRKKVVYDFDDAIWIPHASATNRYAARIKWHRKVAAICRWSYRVSVGNHYLGEYAGQFNPNVVLNPTTIETEQHYGQTKDQDSIPLVIGWTGSQSTIFYLDQLLPVLDRLRAQYDFEFLVISNTPPHFTRDYLRFVPWASATEVDNIRRMHIGLMPLTDDRWARGKCGLKALQYLALGIPALVSPVGVNADIVAHGEQGYHCMTDDDWYQYLSELLKDTEKRTQMGQAGRKKVVEQYSVRSNTENFAGLFAL